MPDPASADGATPVGGAPSAAGGRTSMLRAAVRPRMLVMLALLVGAALVCGRLGAWQLDRAEVRGERAAAEALAEAESAPVVGLGTVLAPQTTFPGELVGRRVEVAGTYDASGQLLVVNRELDGRPGYLVLTPLRVTDADPGGDGDAAGTSGAGDTAGTAGPVDGAGAVLPVVRGWVADPGDAVVLEVPAGPVTVTGYLQASEDSGSAALPAGRTDSVSSAELLGDWGGPIWTGYMVLSGSQPPQDDALVLLPVPTRSGTGLNIQNLAYAAQWWIFGGFALFLWWRLVRDEAAGDPFEGDPVDPAGPADPTAADAPLTTRADAASS
ncbi:SURF1 family protein [Cellulomonas hominis]